MWWGTGRGRGAESGHSSFKGKGAEVMDGGDGVGERERLSLCRVGRDGGGGDNDGGGRKRDHPRQVKRYCTEMFGFFGVGAFRSRRSRGTDRLQHKAVVILCCTVQYCKAAFDAVKAAMEGQAVAPENSQRGRGGRLSRVEYGAIKTRYFPCLRELHCRVFSIGLSPSCDRKVSPLLRIHFRRYSSALAHFPFTADVSTRTHALFFCRTYFWFAS